MTYELKVNVNGVRIVEKSTNFFLNLENYCGAQGPLRTIIVRK